MMPPDFVAAEDFAVDFAAAEDFAVDFAAAEHHPSAPSSYAKWRSTPSLLT